MLFLVYPHLGLLDDIQKEIEPVVIITIDHEDEVRNLSISLLKPPPPFRK